jgi:hypothetical protein
MKSLDFSRRELLCCVAAAMLAGCGGSQPPIGAPGTMPQALTIAAHAERGTSWMLPEAKSEDLLYSGGESVYVLSYPSGELVGILYSALTNGMCSDKNGDVFLTSPDGPSLTEYAHGGTQPIASLSIPNGEGGSPVFDCAVDPTTGNLAAAFDCFGSTSQCVSSDEIAVFKNASGTPTEYGGPNLPQFLYCGYDNAGNLFADGLPVDGSGIFAELPKGSKKLTDISLDESIKKVGQVQWDGTHMTIQDRARASLYRLRISGSAATVVGTTKFSSIGPAQQSWIQGSGIVMPWRHSLKDNSILGFWKYPAGGAPTKTINNKDFEFAFTGTTISVAPKH